MQELVTADFCQVVDFFKPDLPNYPVAAGVIAGNHPGRIWVDNRANPQTVLLVSQGYYSFLLTKKEFDQTDYATIIHLLKGLHPIKLIWQSKLFSIAPFLAAGFKPVDRIAFDFPNFLDMAPAYFDQWCHQLPADFEVKTMNAKLLEKSHWLTYIKLFYGSEANFLQKGLGLALCHKNEIITEVFICYIGDKTVETGSITAEPHRGKGYATIARAFLLKELLSRHLQPVSSCNVDNPPSAKASLKLGFVKTADYKFLTYNLG